MDDAIKLHTSFARVKKLNKDKHYEFHPDNKIKSKNSN